MQLRNIAHFKKNKSSKGYTIKGMFVGLVIKYHSNGNLKSAGHFNSNLLSVVTFPGGRKLGHWKFYDEEGVISKEEIYIR